MINARAQALWLAARVGDIARHEQAGDFCAQLAAYVLRIEHTINRPRPPRILGPCTAYVGQSHDRQCSQAHPHQCGIAVTAMPDDVEATCVHCGTVHDIERLIQQQMDAMDGESYTLRELQRVILPVAGITVPARTLHYWISRGQLTPTGFAGDTPRYLLRDVRELRESRPQNGATGAATHRNRRVS